MGEISFEKKGHAVCKEVCEWSAAICGGLAGGLRKAGRPIKGQTGRKALRVQKSCVWSSSCLPKKRLLRKVRVIGDRSGVRSLSDQEGQEKRQDGRVLHPPPPLHHHIWRHSHPTAHICPEEPLPGGCASVALPNGDLYVVLLDLHLHDPDEPPDRTHPQQEGRLRCQGVLGRSLYWSERSMRVLQQRRDVKPFPNFSSSIKNSNNIPMTEHRHHNRRKNLLDMWMRYAFPFPKLFCLKNNVWVTVNLVIL